MFDRHGVADSADLATLTSALNNYCSKHRVHDEDDREQVGRRLMCLFWLGLDGDKLLSELEHIDLGLGNASCCEAAPTVPRSSNLLTLRPRLKR